ncbi:BamA/TamA family outer membrane protein [Mucilaginibacter glaciei]|uniref:BamA/TamA family outer membrane protein n=1 Tax=Mucilaginibacter glaciei TaxID=2772109 RepID=A0A926P013_9SPHI|nr:BamA/TamA family outer membrane protein [Mucilaginibacter glaciei]MBD1394819.1 BamA/TamA family outer membrane protein [Mucilaginibacter glaciei]
MLKNLPGTLLLVFASLLSRAQQLQPFAQATFKDSTIIKVHPVYNNVGSFHRWLFGANYRKEWATPVKLPIIKISELYGGLTPVKEGGGMQSKSLRLVDKSGREWVLRSVEKTPDKLLPLPLQNTFAVDWINDALSGQHPYSALVVPPLAAAANVPHANPVIGVVADDNALGEYRKAFAGTVCLLEEREPTGKSDNTEKTLANLAKDYDNRLDGKAILSARMLDMLLGDWDRHEDQWRWQEEKTGKGQKLYTGVPRDRDQVFHLEEGLLPDFAALSFINPLLGDFKADIPTAKYWLAKTRFVNPLPDAQMSYAEWMKIVNEFTAAETDAVLEEGLRRLPKEVYGFRHNELLNKLKRRRDQIPRAMSDYYHFIYRIVDLRATNKDEQITITGKTNGSLHVAINKFKNKQVGDTLFSLTYNPDITQELRLYTGDGDDHIVINSNRSPIKIRIVGGKGNNTYNVLSANKAVSIYDDKATKIEGDAGRLNTHLSADTMNTKFVPTNLYNIWQPLATAGLNVDDGFLLGVGAKYTKKDGFRKLPYSSTQQLLITHSFATDAFRIKYNGEWIAAIGKADLLLNANIQAPDNTLNFFGLGNQTVLNKAIPNYRRFYRTRFDTYEFDVSLRWHTGSHSTLSIGPSIQFYHLDFNDNAGRFITNAAQIGSYDSLTVNKDKAHLGLVVNLNINKRKDLPLPKGGYYLNVTLEGYDGLNGYSKSYAQLRPEFTFYQKINSKGTIILSDRVGGGVTIGQQAFYQSMFLGGQGNLLGYVQNRFAGKHMVYNNLQARAKLLTVRSYILPGELGVTGFYDTGRVWAEGESSTKWHQGTGGGLYFSPAGLLIFQVLAGHSNEGWYPYVSFNVRI